MFASELVEKLLLLIQEEGDFRVTIPAPDWERMDKVSVETISLLSEAVPAMKMSEGVRVLSENPPIKVRTMEEVVDETEPIQFYNYIVLDCA
jgi:hypothetical protein